MQFLKTTAIEMFSNVSYLLERERENKFRLIPYLKYILCFANTQSNIYPGMNFYPDMSINVEKKHSLVFIDLYIVQ